MDWLWIILRYLFPLDPVRQCIAALCDRVTAMVQLILDDDALDELASNPDARIALEAALIDYEATLRLTIAARAHQIAKLRFVPGKKSFHRPARARSLVDLVKRIQILAKDCTDIERLAQRQAIRLKRERDADPLGLAAHGSTDAALRAAAHHEAVGVASIYTSAKSGLILSSARTARPSTCRAEAQRRREDEAVLTARPTAQSRAPPVFDVRLTQTPRLAGFACEVAPRSAGQRFSHVGAPVRSRMQP